MLRGHRGGTEVGSPGYNSFASLPPTDHMHHSSDETEDTSPDSLDDYYSESQHDTRDTSPADGSKDHNDEDEEEMFALDMGDLKVVEEEPEPGQPAPPQRVQLPPFGAHQRMNQSPLPSIQSSSRWVGNDWAKRETGLPYSELGISAPSKQASPLFQLFSTFLMLSTGMGFFEPRRQTGFGTPAPGTSPPMATTTEERSSAAWGSQ